MGCLLQQFSFRVSFILLISLGYIPVLFGFLCFFVLLVFLLIYVLCHKPEMK